MPGSPARSTTRRCEVRRPRACHGVRSVASSRGPPDERALASAERRSGTATAALRLRRCRQLTSRIRVADVRQVAAAAQLVDLLGPTEAPQLETPEVAQRHAVGKAVGDELGGGLRHSTWPPPASPRNRAVRLDRGAEVVALLHLRFAGVHAGAHPQLDVLGPRLRGDRALEGKRGRGRVGGARERRQRAVAFALRARHPTAVGLGDLGCELVVAGDHVRPSTSGCASHNGVEPSMSVSTNVTTPVGSTLSRALRSRSTRSLAVGGRRAGIGVEGAPQYTVEPFRELRRHALPRDRLPGRGRLAGERTHDGCREREDVGGGANSPSISSGAR